MIKEAIILAGGLGTRLRPLLRDIPKPMAMIGEHPFLEYVLIWLGRQGLKKVILSVGYRYEVIREYFSMQFRGVEISYSIEDEPLGTGGAIKKALSLLNGENTFVLNGDTYFDIGLGEFERMHEERGAEISIALKEMKNSSRYGAVELGPKNRIVKFHEKSIRQSALINGGIYIVPRDMLDEFISEEKFSFEVDVLERYVHRLELFGFVFDSYFVDIGVPEDLIRAQGHFTKDKLEKKDSSQPGQN